jgi:hypothetical protein
MYEKMENSLEFANNKLLFMEKESDQNMFVLEKIKEIEFKMSETKDLCQIIVPEEIKHVFPIIYHTNIFRVIHKMELYRKNLISKFKDVKNEMRYIMHKWTTEESADSMQRIKEKRRLLYLMELKEQTKDELIEYKNTYNQIDELFLREMKYSESRPFFTIWKMPPKHDINTLNPAIRDYLHLWTDKSPIYIT